MFDQLDVLIFAFLLVKIITQRQLCQERYASSKNFFIYYILSYFRFFDCKRKNNSCKYVRSVVGIYFCFFACKNYNAITAAVNILANIPVFVFLLVKA